MRMWSFLLFCSMLSSAGSFTVSVPSSPLLVVRGETALLSCQFTPDQTLSNLVINWQREEDYRVIHSFYYQKDQLDRQSKDYLNRTSLFHGELSKGNASLRIANIQLNDAGSYLCIVSNSQGNDRGAVQLVYTAIYSEPRLSIILDPLNVMMRYETEGYPQPEVSWRGGGGQELSDNREVSNTSDGGLYYLKSSYVTQNPAVNLTFTLKNPLAHQEIHRQITFSYDKDSKSNSSVVILSVLCSVLLISTGFLLYLQCCKQR
ncbi:hypothetical protein DNTS_025956 [Danionella cerebrum]|uniref:Ig-like domain-containing protein n=1 Tax=Danionella cerebrum TaxID=2873325 RepID=A0A553R818_9TELE|nr:hypothetical protein DNTS_025956 [Danionella translucida]